ncbi:aminotransferase class V-fold PLP-dependent enzyme [Clostridium botulinum]|uniref:aminotransferase class V-fold PLP-dependent enzyme n=1 Tax=Clostridium botulinum TaxID=1491 RepID=UPI00052CCBF6|nr:aminotransferase class V-fold PLP-dependent enzyme [Clostridium botulinum]KGM94277.1 cysteine desulfurase [Clostridium botulinum D str. CCUG 7971]NFO99082.1 aminotransferase class V-fold PLP-dependent enzyme [Clostridium botulinum]OOV51109.1 cysteine desulfurase [Clostridium botulinum D/C]OOV53257.1 cysteine desulfurase [Clostridium botulinum D/C]OOV53680.1 cysteine desulfurase [Clostridium botulinum D/C]
MIYLDNAATSFPKPNEVYYEVLNCMKSYAANPGRGSYDMAIRAEEKIMECRERICDLFNIKNVMNMIFTSNATESLNIVIKGILKPEDHVISTYIEHNSVLRPINTMKKKGIEVTLLKVDKQGYIDLKELENSIQYNTKAIVINHASNVLGTIQNIENIGRIAKNNNIIFVVDASQSAESIPIDVKKYNIDFLAFPGHKGLLGPEGVGGLYINSDINIIPYTEGGTGSESQSMSQPEFLPDKFESGTKNTPGIAGLCEGLKFIKKVGIENIRKHEMNLCKYLIDALNKIPKIIIYGHTDFENRAPVVSFNIENVDSSDVGYILNKSDICVRTGYHCAPLIHGIIGTKNKGTVRVSPGYFNTKKEIDILVWEIKKKLESI